MVIREQPGSEPAATLELFIARDWHLHVEIDGVVMAPLTLIDHSKDAIEKKIRDIRRDLDNLDNLATTLSASSARHYYDKAATMVGRALGEILFGTAGRNNQIQHVLGRLYERATDSYVLISLCIEDMSVECLPWEAAIWQRGGRDVTLGTDPQLAFVRRMMAYGYETRPASRAQIPPLNVLHVGATPGAGHHFHDDHVAIEQMLQNASRDRQMRVSVVTSTELWPTDRPVHVFHYYGHGSRDGLLLYMNRVAGDHGGEVQFTPERLLPMLGADSPAPLLCVLLACQSFGPADATRRGLAWQFLQLGAEAAVGILGSARMGFGLYFLEVLYSTLPEHGSLARAIQTVRRMKRMYGGAAQAGHSPDNDWFRFALLVRNLTALRAFAPLRKRYRGTGAPVPHEAVQYLREALVESPSYHDPVAQVTQLNERLARLAADAAIDAFAPQVDAAKLADELQQHASQVMPQADGLETIDTERLNDYQNITSVARYHIRWSAVIQALVRGVPADAAIAASSAKVFQPLG